MARVRVCSWEDVGEVPLGTYVELRGTLTAHRPVRSPTSGEGVVGFHALCSLFTKSSGIGMPDFLRREDRMDWSDAVLRGPATSIEVSLAEGARVPASHESTLEGEAMRGLLDRLDVDAASLVQVQVLERSVPDGARVRVRGVLTDVAARGSAFRSSARARRGLVGEPGRPLVILEA